MVQPSPLRERAERRGQPRGCLFWGGFTVGIVVLVIGICTGVGLYRVYREVLDFSSPEPHAVEVYEPAPGQVDSILKRLADAAETPGAAAQLTGEDLDALVASRPWLETVPEGGRLRLRIEDDLVAADVSWPLDEIPGLSGRYFAGTFKIRLAIDDGASTVAIEEGVSATGRRLSRSLRRRLGLRLEAALHRRFEAELRSIESLDVRQGRIWIRWISP